MHPQVQMIGGHVGPDVAYLLLAVAPDFLHAGVRVGREEGKPAMFLFDEYHSNDAADRSIRGQKEAVGISDGGRDSRPTAW